MKKRLRYIKIMVVILFWSQRTFSAAVGPGDGPPTTPQPVQWKVHLASIPLTFMNYYALTRAVVPITIKTNNFFRSEALSPGLAFGWSIAAGFLLNPVFAEKIAETIGFLSAAELNQAQRNALVYASVYYATPDSLKDRLKRIYPALKSIYPALRRSFFKKTHNGITVKSFEKAQELVPIITDLNMNIRNEFIKIMELEAKGDLSKNFDTFRGLVSEFSNSVVKREVNREQLYEHYDNVQLSQLKESAQNVLTIAHSKTTDVTDLSNAFEQLKELYTKIQGGILGIAGEGLKYFEGG